MDTSCLFRFQETLWGEIKFSLTFASSYIVEYYLCINFHLHSFSFNFHHECAYLWCTYLWPWYERNNDQYCLTHLYNCTELLYSQYCSYFQIEGYIPMECSHWNYRSTMTHSMSQQLCCSCPDSRFQFDRLGSLLLDLLHLLSTWSKNEKKKCEKNFLTRIIGCV